VALNRYGVFDGLSLHRGCEGKDLGARLKGEKRAGIAMAREIEFHYVRFAAGREAAHNPARGQNGARVENPRGTVVNVPSLQRPDDFAIHA
jgi:hypothetical protein